MITLHPRISKLTAAFALAAFLVFSASAPGEVHQVDIVGVSFVPQDIDGVAPGDTVRWVRSAGTHTVTSGSDCTFDGLYFDENLNSANPIFEWEVPMDASGLIPYYCRPHCDLFDMFGTVNVVGGSTCPGDLSGDSIVGFADLLAVLSNWGVCDGCDEDITGDGLVGFDDLLEILSTWGPC